MAFSSRTGPIPTPFWQENAVLAYPFWLRLCRVKGKGIGMDGLEKMARRAQEMGVVT
jgi:hypothetical protein